MEDILKLLKKVTHVYFACCISAFKSFVVEPEVELSGAALAPMHKALV